MDAHASDPETAGGEPQFASRSPAPLHCIAPGCVLHACAAAARNPRGCSLRNAPWLPRLSSAPAPALSEPVACRIKSRLPAGGDGR